MSGQSPAERGWSPQADLMKLTTGHWITQGIYVAAKLGIADLIQERPLSTVLAEMPAVIDGARRQLEAAHLADRTEVVPIDFFESVPAGGDAYVMKRVIHDWDDERSTVILKNCHRAMAGKGKLLLVEMVIPPSNDPDFSKWLDIAMLVYSGGCEHTERVSRSARRRRLSAY